MTSTAFTLRDAAPVSARFFAVAKVANSPLRSPLWARRWSDGVAWRPGRRGKPREITTSPLIATVIAT